MVWQPAVASAVRRYAAAGARIGCSRPSKPSSCAARRVACAASASAASAGGDETVSAGGAARTRNALKLASSHSRV